MKTAEGIKGFLLRDLTKADTFFFRVYDESLPGGHRDYRLDDIFDLHVELQDRFCLLDDEKGQIRNNLKGMKGKPAL